MNEGLLGELLTPHSDMARIMVVGVGGAGSNAVNHMWSLGIEGVGFLVCNTDDQALTKSPVEYKIQLGKEGLGAGNDPENGRKAAIESIEEVRHCFERLNTKMIFITAGMGGGTGTGASPIIAKLAKEMGLLTVAIVTSPLAVEGKIRYEQALKGIEELNKNVDSLLVINNESIVQMYGRLSLKQAFGKADDVLALAAKGIAEIITVNSDLVNVDFADVEKVMRNSGRAHMSVATAEGEDRAEKVAELSLNSPLLDHNLIVGAKNILLNVSVANSEELIMEEVITILKYIQDHASVQDENGNIQNANIIWGTSEKPSLGRAIELVVVATGFASEEEVRRMPKVFPHHKPATKRENGSDILNGSFTTKTYTPEYKSEQVILGEKSTKYEGIEKMLSTPAYLTRNVQFVVSSVGNAKKELLQKEDDSTTREEANQSGSLFENKSQNSQDEA